MGFASVNCGEQVMGLAFHPTSPLFAASLISGSVKCFHNGASSSSSSSSTSSSASYTLQHTFSDHVESARVVVFNHSGDWVVSGSSDCSLRAYSSETGQSVWEAPRAHLAGLYVLNGQVEGRENLLISGDENGGMRLWDVRQSGEKPLHSCEAHSDYISDMTFDVERQRLLTTSGDGKLGVFEMRKSRVKLERMSDEQEHELLCVQIVKRGKKVVVGAQDGVLNLWSWGTWGDLSDRFPGHPESIDALLKVDEDTVCTGSSDGIIRFISILPNKLIGVAGDHDGFPIERMAFSHDRASIESFNASYIVTASHDSLVRFFDVSYLNEDSEDSDKESKTAEAGESEEEDSDESDAPSQSRKRRKTSSKAKLQPVGADKNAAFFSDL